MEGVESVTQRDDKRLHWVAEIAGTREEWDAEIVEQKPDRRIAWRAITGTKNDGIVTFDSLRPNSTRVSLDLDVAPESLKEKIGEKLGFDAIVHASPPSPSPAGEWERAELHWRNRIGGGHRS